MFQQPPPTEDEISYLPLDFVLLQSAYERELFTDKLLSIWIALAESGSLATLPPVPDIVGFASDCVAFFLIYHTNTSLLNFPPGVEPNSSTEQSSEPSTSTFGSPSKDYSYEEPPTHPLESSQTRDVIGCVYLSLSSATQSTVDVGVALRPDARGRGYGRAALTKVMRYAFETLRMHRVVANVFGPSFGLPAAQARASAKESGTVRWVFEKLGFTYEGVNRRAGFSATDGAWRDVHVLAMLDTDWLLLQRRVMGRASVLTPWDTLMERHEKEREEMSEWMEDPNWGKLRRMGSTETIKGTIEPEPEPLSETNPFVTQGAPTHNSGPGGPSQPYPIDDDDDIYSYEDSDNNSDDDQPAANSDFAGANAWAPGERSDSPVLGSQASSPPAPASSVGVSPPASVVSLPSDFDWRSV
ncbi:hypothetical protein FRC07_010440, partial [Ceratobasidium sp. 392]